jgi:nitrate reductase gamma subunit
MAAHGSVRHVSFHFGSALLAVSLLCAIAVFCVPSIGSVATVAMATPAFAALFFVVGFSWKVARWMRAPIAFRIPLTAGQHSGLSSTTPDRFRAPHTAWEVLVRVLFDVVLFRPLLRVTPSVHLHGRQLSGYSGRLLWLFAATFHGSLAIIVLRHLRLFLSPVPSFVSWLQSADSASDLFIPKLHATSALVLIALSLLLTRRLVLVRLRYISVAADYFPLLLLLGIAVTGVTMRHVTRTDVAEVKALITSLAGFSFVLNSPLDTLLVVHVFLVCALLVYFPLSKLMHVSGAFMSPTLTLAANGRSTRHLNVNNPQVETLHYSDYEVAFRDRMIKAGIPVEEP